MNKMLKRMRDFFVKPKKEILKRVGDFFLVADDNGGSCDGCCFLEPGSAGNCLMQDFLPDVDKEFSHCNKFLAIWQRREEVYPLRQKVRDEIACLQETVALQKDQIDMLLSKWQKREEICPLKPKVSDEIASLQETVALQEKQIDMLLSKWQRREESCPLKPKVRDEIASLQETVAFQKKQSEVIVSISKGHKGRLDTMENMIDAMKEHQGPGEEQQKSGKILCIVPDLLHVVQ